MRHGSLKLNFGSSSPRSRRRPCKFTPDRVELRDDHLIVNNKHMSFEDACRLIGPELGRIKAYGVFDPVAELDLKTFKGDTYPTYTFATHLAEVEVDPETGRIDTSGILGGARRRTNRQSARRRGSDRRRHRHGLGHGALGETGPRWRLYPKSQHAGLFASGHQGCAVDQSVQCLSTTTTRPAPSAPKEWPKQVLSRFLPPLQQLCMQRSAFVPTSCRWIPKRCTN